MQMKQDVVVYYITGRQVGPLSVPASWCPECDLTVRAVSEILQEVDPSGRLRFVARPWLRHALSALIAGGWHPPVVLIDGDLFSQGVVPSRDALRERLEELARSRRTAESAKAAG